LTVKGAAPSLGNEPTSERARLLPRAATGEEAFLCRVRPSRRALLPSPAGKRALVCAGNQSANGDNFCAGLLIERHNGGACSVEISEDADAAAKADAFRDALIGGTGWSGIGIAAAVLAAWALFSLAAGLLPFGRLSRGSDARDAGSLLNAMAGHPQDMLRIRTDDVDWVEAGDEVIALDHRAAMYLSANSSGAVLWRRLLAGATRLQLVQELTERFAIDSEQAGSDVDRFLYQLSEAGLLATSG
jgi:hypothetical protein